MVSAYVCRLDGSHIDSTIGWQLWLDGPQYCQSVCTIASQLEAAAQLLSARTDFQIKPRPRINLAASTCACKHSQTVDTASICLLLTNLLQVGVSNSVGNWSFLLREGWFVCHIHGIPPLTLQIAMSSVFLHDAAVSDLSLHCTWTIRKVALQLWLLLWSRSCIKSLWRRLASHQVLLLFLFLQSSTSC